MGARNSSSNNNSSRPTSDQITRRKIAIVGDHGTGKTSLMTRFGMDMFYERRRPFGIDFGEDGVGNGSLMDPFPNELCPTSHSVKTLQLDGRDIKVLVIDTRSFRNRIVLSSSLRGSAGVVIVYDVTNQKSFNNLEEFLEQIDDLRGENIVDKLIIGNKCDLTTQRVVEYDIAKEFADKHGIPLVEVSAKTAINVDQAFLRLLVAVMKRTSEQPLCSNNRT